MKSNRVEDLVWALKQARLTSEQVVFFCIGTDRSTGDALGPLVGSYLIKAGFTNVIGTLDDPVHGTNIVSRIEEIPEGSTVIAIDSCLGQLTSVGKYFFGKGPLSPGAGVGHKLPKVGDFHISGVVNIGGFMEYFVLQNTRLSLVMKMATDIAQAIQQVFQPNLMEVAAANESINA